MFKPKHLLPLLIISSTYCGDLTIHAPNEGHMFSTQSNIAKGMVLPGIVGAAVSAYIAGANVINYISVQFLHNIPTQPQTLEQQTKLVTAVAKSLQQGPITPAQTINPADVATASQCTNVIKSLFLSLKPLCKEIDNLRATYEKNATLCEQAWQKCVNALTKAGITNKEHILSEKLLAKTSNNLNLTPKEWNALALKQRYEQAQKVYTFGRAQVEQIAQRLSAILDTQKHTSFNAEHFAQQNKTEQVRFLKARTDELQELDSITDLKEKIQDAICALDDAWVFANSKAQKIIEAYTHSIITTLQRAELQNTIAICKEILAQPAIAKLEQSAVAYLKVLGIDTEKIESCSPKIKQSSLYQENISLINQAEHLASTNLNNEDVQNYASAATHFSVGALELLAEHEPEQATVLTDLASSLLQAGKVLVGVGKGAVEGIIDSVTGTVQTIVHPIDSAVGIAKGIGKLTTFLCNAYNDDPKTIAQIQAACKEFANLPLDQQAEGLSRFLVGMFAPSPLKFTKLASFNKGLGIIGKITTREAQALRKTMGMWTATAQFAWKVQRAELVIFKGMTMLREAADAIRKAEIAAGKVFTAAETAKYLDKIGKSYVRCAQVTREIAKQIKSELKIIETVKTAEEYLGKDVRTIINEYGDHVFLSKDGTRRIRFDINNTDPHNNPHGHIEFKIGNKWQKKPGPIYPIDVPHN